MSLNIDQVDVLAGIAEDMRNVDDAGGFLVLGQEVRPARDEAVRIVVRQFSAASRSRDRTARACRYGRCCRRLPAEMILP